MLIVCVCKQYNLSEVGLLSGFFFQQHRFKYVFWFTCDATLLIFSRSLRPLVNQKSLLRKIVEPKTDLKSKRVASAKIQIERSVQALGRVFIY